MSKAEAAGKKLYTSNEQSQIALTWKKSKEGGANSAGDFGGIYTFQDNGLERLALVKTERREGKQELIAKDMAEYLAGKIFEITAPDHSARISIARQHNESGKETGSPYICSFYLENYQDLFKQVNHDKAPKKDGRVFAAGFVNKITGFFRAQMLGSDGKPKYTGFPETMATSLLIGDFDVHTGNVGLVNGKKLVRIDYAAAFEKLDPEIHPNSRARHPIGKGPTNHFREYPRSLRISPEFADHAFAISAMPLDTKITEAINEMKKHYSVKDFIAFGKRLGVKDQAFLNGVKDIELQETQGASGSKLAVNNTIINSISKHLQTTLKARQESLKQYAIEISIDLCFDSKGNFRDFTKQDDTRVNGEAHFNNLMRSYPEYFKDICSGKQKLHFRDNSHKSTFSFLDWTGLTRGATLEKAVKAKISQQVAGSVKTTLHSEPKQGFLSRLFARSPKTNGHAK